VPGDRCRLWIPHDAACIRHTCRHGGRSRFAISQLQHPCRSRCGRGDRRPVGKGGAGNSAAIDNCPRSLCSSSPMVKNECSVAGDATEPRVFAAIALTRAWAKAAETMGGMRRTQPSMYTIERRAAKRKGPRVSSRPLSRSSGGGQKSMSPMPPPCGMAGGAFFSGFSATIASVVTSRPATDAASCSAVRTTLVGSMMPAFSMST